MSLNGALSIASGSLANINAGLNIISQNVANASTPQYAVEAAVQSSVSASGQGMGVQTGAAILVTDPAVQAEVASAASQNAAAQTTSAALQNINTVLGTVGSNNDLGSRLTAVQSSFSSLLNDPSNANLQSSVVQNAATLAGGINALSQTYGTARQSAQDSLVAQVTQLNTALGTIGSLGSKIVSLQTQGQSTADLQNQLAQVENTVSGLIDARFVTGANGDITVLAQNGMQLPTRVANPLSIGSVTVSPSSSYASGTVPGIMLGNVDVTAQLGGGSIGANLVLRDQTLPTYQATLDEFAANLSNRFAAQGLTLFANASGTVPQSTGTPLQSGYEGYAGTITVNPAVVATPSLVRDGTNAIAGSATGASAFTPNPGNTEGFTNLINRVLTYALGGNAQSGVAQAPIATTGLGPDGTLNAGFSAQTDLTSYANALTASQANDSANATSQAGDAQALQTSLQKTLNSATGVDMDTQLGQMVTLQNAYGANAKVISTVQAMFADVLAMVQG